MTLYYIAINQKQQGPFTIEELKRMNLPTQTLVWYKGLKNWIPISNVKELSEDTPPPLPTEHTAVEIMTNSPIQIELLKQKSTSKDLQDISKRTIRSIKSAFAKFCILFFKSTCVYLILLLIAGASTYIYTSPPKIKKQNQLEYNKEAEKRKIFIDSLSQEYRRNNNKTSFSQAEKAFFYRAENRFIERALQEKQWGSELQGSSYYEQKIIHRDLIDKYLNIEEVNKWWINWRRYIDYYSDHYKLEYNYSSMNESLKRAHDKIFWHKEIFPFQAIFCIFIIIAFWIIKLLVHFIKWVKLNAKSENG